MTERPGPFASVYIETVSDTEDAAHQQRLRSRAVRETLDEDGAESAVLDAVERGLSDPPPGRAGQAVIADVDGVLLTAALPEPPARTTVRLSDMPYLLPLLQLRPPAVAHVVVVVDDRGADLYAVDGDGHRTDRRTGGRIIRSTRCTVAGGRIARCRAGSRRRCAGPSMPPPTRRCRRPRSRPAPAS